MAEGSHGAKSGSLRRDQSLTSILFSLRILFRQVHSGIRMLNWLLRILRPFIGIDPEPTQGAEQADQSAEANPQLPMKMAAHPRSNDWRQGTAAIASGIDNGRSRPTPAAADFHSGGPERSFASAHHAQGATEPSHNPGRAFRHDSQVEKDCPEHHAEYRDNGAAFSVA